MRGGRAVLGLLAGTLLSTASLSAPAPVDEVVLAPGQTRLALERAGRLLHDPDRRYSPEQAAAQMRASPDHDDALQLQGRGYWLYLRLRNTDPVADWVVSSSNHLYSRIEAWQHLGGRWQAREVSPEGHGRYGFDLLRHFAVALPRNEPTELLLRLETRTFHPPQFLLQPAPAARGLAQGYSAAVLLSIGGAIALLLYNLMLAVSLRSGVLVGYVLYATVHIGFMAYAAGLLGWLLPMFEQMPQRLPSAATVIAILFFTHLFFRAGPTVRHSGKCMVVLAVGLAITGLATLSGSDALVQATVLPYLFCFFGGLLLVLVLATYQVWRGYRPARIFLLAWGALVIGYLAAGVLLVVPNLRTPWSNVLPLAGGSIEMILLSLALAQQISGLRRERNQARMQEALAQQQAQRKAEFVSTLSHEIRAPLVGMQAGLRQLAVAHGVGSESLSDVRHACAALNDLLDNLLDRAALGDGAATPAPVSFDPDRLVEASLAVYRARAQEKGLVLQADACALGDCHGSPEVLRRGLLNLLSNAIKFSDSGEIRVQCERQGNFLVATVCDQGRGISADRLRTLQQRFGRDLDQIYAREPGSGLGLPLTAELLAQVGGRLQIDSQPGVGSRIALYLPLHPPPEGAAIAPFLAGQNVLVVEDSVARRQLWCEQWQALGARCQMAAGQAEAWALLKEPSDALEYVLTDQQLLEGTGLALIRQLRDQREPGIALRPVLLASASLSQAQRQQAAELGIWVLDPRHPEWLTSPAGQRSLQQWQGHLRELVARLQQVRCRRLQGAATVFLEQLAEDCERLALPASAAGAAHRIASAAFGLGLAALAELALAAEQALKADPSAPVDDLLESVAGARVAVRALLAVPAEN